MNMRMIVPIAVGAMLLASPVLAVDITNPVRPVAPSRPFMNKPKTPKPRKMVPTAECAALQRQLDMEIGRHANSPKIEDANKMREEGRAACSGRDQRGGIMKLQQGLQALGVKPKN